MTFNDFMDFYGLKNGGKIDADYWRLKKTGSGANFEAVGPSETYFTIDNNGENYVFVTKESKKEIKLFSKDCAVAYYKNLQSLIFVKLNIDEPSTEVHILSNIVKLNK